MEEAMRNLVSISAIAALWAVAPAMAQTMPDKDDANRAAQVENRIDHQQDKVSDDLAKGQISASQAAQDQTRLSRIQGHLAADQTMSGGGISASQQSQLNRRLNVSNSLITSQRRR
jgi:hypothetical protein